MNILVLLFLCCAHIGILLANYDDIYNYEENETPFNEEEEVDENHHKPKIVSKNETILVNEDGDVSFKCLVDDLGNHQLIWTKRPGEKGEMDQLFVGLTEIKKDPRRSIADIDGSKGSVLTISQVRPMDFGRYTCKVAATSYHSSVHFTLIAADKPRTKANQANTRNLSVLGASVALAVLLIGL